MKRFWILSLATLIALGSLSESRAEAPATKDPRADNAALFYWQAFGLMVKLDDKHQAALDKAVKGEGPVDDQVMEIVEWSAAALGQLHRGVRCSRCVWGLDTDLGLDTPLCHAWRARKLAELACLRARVRFEEGQAGGAIDDLAAAMTLGRHVAEDGLLIVVLVDYAIERMAIQTAAASLPTLEPEKLTALAERLENLPPKTTLREAILAEKEVFIGWFVRAVEEPGGWKRLQPILNFVDEPGATDLTRFSLEEMIQGVKALPGVYDQLAELASLPPDKIEKAERELVSEDNLPGFEGTLARLVVPALSATRHNEAVHQTYWAMLNAAIAVGQRGKAALVEEEHQDPFGDGPFQYVEREGGYELRAKLPQHPNEPDKPVSLTVGRPAQE